MPPAPRWTAYSSFPARTAGSPDPPVPAPARPRRGSCAWGGRAVDVVHLGDGGGTLNGCANLLGQLALRADQILHLLLPLGEVSQCCQLFVQRTQDAVVQTARDLLAVPGNEGNGVPFVDQLYRFSDLLRSQVQLLCQCLYDIHLLSLRFSSRGYERQCRTVCGIAGKPGGIAGKQGGIAGKQGGSRKGPGRARSFGSISQSMTRLWEDPPTSRQDRPPYRSGSCDRRFPSRFRPRS